MASCRSCTRLLALMVALSVLYSSEQVRRSDSIGDHSSVDEEQKVPAVKEDELPLLFVHVHKNAGSTMCAAAATVGEKVVQPNSNCNWLPVDKWDPYSKFSKGKSCAERKAYFKEHGYTYGQVERRLQDEDLCFDDFRYAVLLRQPLDRIRSHVAFDGLSKETLVAELRARLGEGSQSQGLLEMEESLGEEPQNFKVMDNYQIRILANALDVAAGGITEAHVKLAKVRLERFKLVGTVEMFKTEEGRSRIMGALKWDREPSHSLLGHENELKKRLEPPAFTEEEEEILTRANEHDLALYQWALSQG